MEDVKVGDYVEARYVKYHTSIFEGAIKDWIKCAFYLGVVFSKTTEDHLSFFLGVDTKWKVI